MLEIRNIHICNMWSGCVIDNKSPEISFSLTSDTPATFLEKATITFGDRVFQYGKEQTGIVLDNLSLKPFEEYSLILNAEDNHGEKAEVSFSFNTGRLGLKWEGKWITDKSLFVKKKEDPIPMTFLKEFSIEKPIKRAFITSTSIGIYELELNGEKVGDDYFAPGFTSYKKNLQYQYYDVTERVKEKNTLEAVVAGGWAVGRFTYENKNKITADRGSLLLELFIDYCDGSREKIVTDNSWQVTLEGPYKSCSLYDGEVYDATIKKEKVRWKRADEIKLKFSPIISLNSNTMVKRHERMVPVRHFKNSQGVWIYDFGQNFAGVVSLSILGKKGEVIHIRHGEVLDGDKLYTASLRTAKAEVIYTCRDGRQFYSPKFTYMGFRYISVDGIEPEKIDVAAYALYSDFSTVGSFECSNEDINKLQRNILWAGKSNFVDIPTDCPQRDERQGWTGDISVFASTACFNFDLSSFLEKWLNDVKLEQGRGGGIPFVVPKHGSSTPVVATALWGDSCIIVPWEEYIKRGNKELLRRQYKCMKKYMKAVKFWTSLYGPGDRKYVWKWLFQFGDWCAPEGSVKDWLSRGKWMGTPFYAYTSSLMAKIAEILGKTDNQKYYEKLNENIRRAYDRLLTDGKGKLTEEFQTGYVLPLYFNMEEGERRERMAANLNRMVVENGYHINTGFPGTPYILFALADNGYKDTTFKLLLQDTCPSWIYCLRQGATSFWEQWNAITPDGVVRNPSMNHYAYGAVGDFFYRRILGLESLEGGYKSFVVKPLLGGGITYVKGCVDTPYGRISVNWTLNKDEFTIGVEVPVSTECKLVMPSGEKFKLHSGIHRYSEIIGGFYDKC